MATTAQIKEAQEKVDAATAGGFRDILAEQALQKLKTDVSLRPDQSENIGTLVTSEVQKNIAAQLDAKKLNLLNKIDAPATKVGASLGTAPLQSAVQSQAPTSPFGRPNPNPPQVQPFSGALIEQGQSVFSRDVAPVRAGQAAQAAQIQQGPAFAGALLNQAPQQQIRQQQVQLAQQLQGQASGTAPSLAEAKLKQESDRSLAQQLGAAAAQRGGNQAALQRTLANSQAEQSQQLAQVGAQARIAEQQQAQQALGQLTGQVRGQDLALAQAQAQLQQQAGLQGQQLESGRLGQEAGFRQQAGLSASEQAQQREILQAQLVQQSRGREAASADARALAQAGLLQEAGLQGQQLNQQQQQLEFQRQQQKDAFALQLQQQGLSAEQANLQAELAIKQMENQRIIAREQLTSQAAIAEAQRAAAESASDNAFLGGLATTAGSVAAAALGGPAAAGIAQKGVSAATSGLSGTGGGGSSRPDLQTMSASDKRLKKNIKDGSKKARKFLDQLSSFEFEYKDSKYGKGKRLGVMAQDLEKAGATGRGMVHNTPEGKMVDFGAGFGAILAAATDLNKRLTELESRKSKKSKKKRG